MGTQPAKIFFMWAAVIVAAAAFGFSAYMVRQLYENNVVLRSEVAALEANVARIEKENTNLAQSLQAEQDRNTNLMKDLRDEQDKNTNLTKDLQNERSANRTLTQALEAERGKNSAYESQIKEISGTVGTLKKLSETDRELLNKYSRVYFLNENYVPAQLTAIDSQYLYNENRAEQIHLGVAPYLRGMLAAAAQDGVTLKIVSAFRSFSEQAAVKTGYKMLYGSGANKFSADQGYSEHQLGTTVDLTSPEVQGLTVKFETTVAYAWLGKNAHKYGFTLSYPKDNVYYQYEPWHWRFIGVGLATKLHDEGKHFYELTQREIDAYLVSIFD